MTDIATYRKIPLLFVILLMAACSSTSYETVYPTLSDGKYDSEFPYRNCSEQLEEISQSLVKLDVLVFYHTHTFSLESKTSMEMIRNTSVDLSGISSASDVFSESVGGTAVAVYYSDKHIAFLTCAHIINYPDTVVTYFPYPNDNFVQVIGIKARQQNSIGEITLGSEFEILAMDSKNDIAILGKEISGEKQNNVKVFSYPMGDSEELEWGSFVYIMGFPLGHEMITRGIVSDPARIRKGSFLIDAVFNQGFSGGPVIAVRDGVPNFEIVGMVKSSAAVNRNYLAPAKSKDQLSINASQIYTGEIKVNTEKDIKYGITFSVTTATLRAFYEKHRQSLEERGYFLDGFFAVKKN
jgi:hypothetical protein